MAINFPSSPSVNDTHTHSGKEWTWNGTSWVLSTNASNYTLPIATAGALGGIKVGSRLTIDSSTGVLSADVQGGGGTSTTINNNADNRLITGSGTANTLEAESDLTFDPSSNRLSIGENGTDAYLEVGTGAPGTSSTRFSIRSNNSSNYLYSYASSMLHIALAGNGDTIQFDSISETFAQFKKNAECSLWYNNTKRIETTDDGIKITGGIQDKDGQLGTSGQILSSTGTELDWIDAPSGGGASVTVSDNAPSGPSAGDLWWDSDNGRLKVYYTDATPDSQWVDASPLGANSSIGAGNTSISITDTGTNGNIAFNTDGTDRWKITSGGHIIPYSNASFDIGNAEYKVRHLFLSDNSLKFIDDNDVEHALSVNSNKLHYEGKEVLANCVFTGLDNNETIQYNGTNWVNVSFPSPSSISQLNSGVSVTDTGSNGTITITTEGADRWTWNDNGHLLPSVTGGAGLVTGFDIGSAAYKVREFHCSTANITPLNGITTTQLNVSGDVTIDTNVLKVDTSQNRVGIGTASPNSLLHLYQPNDAVYITFGQGQHNTNYWVGTYGTTAGFFIEQGSSNNNLLTADASDYVSLYGAGTKRFETTASGVTITGDISVTGSGLYNDGALDARINTATATSNQLLSWTGSDYDWIDAPTPAAPAFQSNWRIPL